jgi:hypothetical protein
LNKTSTSRAEASRSNLGFIATANAVPAITGIGSVDPARREPGFLPGVLQFICAHEPTLLQFAEASGIPPRRSRQRALPLGDDRYEGRHERSRPPGRSPNCPDDRPLLVVDDVLMEFVEPFTRYLHSQGLELGLSASAAWQHYR